MALGKGGGDDLPAIAPKPAAASPLVPAPVPVKSYGSLSQVLKVVQPTAPVPSPLPTKTYGNIADLAKVVPVTAPVPPPAPLPVKAYTSLQSAEALKIPIPAPIASTPMTKETPVPAIKAYTSLKSAKALNIPIPPPAHPVATPAAHAVLTAQATTPKVPVKAYTSLKTQNAINDAAVAALIFKHANAGNPDPIAGAAAENTAGIPTEAMPDFGTPGGEPAAGMQVDSQGNPDPNGEDSQGGIATVSQAEVFHYYVTYYGKLAQAIHASP